MAAATARPTTAQLLYAHTQTLVLIEELHVAVRDMPLLEAADADTVDRFFDELDDLQDAVDGLASQFRKNTRV